VIRQAAGDIEKHPVNAAVAREVALASRPGPGLKNQIIRDRRIHPDPLFFSTDRGRKQPCQFLVVRRELPRGAALAFDRGFAR